MYITHDEDLDASRVRTVRPGRSVGPAVIILGRGPRLQVDNVAEADALIAAACEAKRLLAGECPAVAEHTGRRCEVEGPHFKHRNGMVVWGSGVTEPDPAAHVKAAPTEAHRVQLGPNPPLYVAPGTGERCRAEHPGVGSMCIAQPGHDGPEHVVYGVGGRELARFPVADALPPNEVPAGVDSIGARF